MLYNEFFYPGMFRKYMVAFGSIIDGLQVVRFNKDGSENFRTTVPVTYAKKEKWIQKLISDPDLKRKPAITLPRIAYEMTDFRYASYRKLSNQRYFAFVNPSTPSTNYKVFMPIPYDFYFSVYIAAKTQQDMFQVFEQIVPFFAPDYTLSLNGVKNPSINFDIPVSLLTPNLQDDAEGGFEDRRVLIGQLDFVLKGYLFGPVRQAGIIKTVNVNIYNLDQLNVTPSSRGVMVDIDVMPVLEGKTLAEIVETDPWEIEATITE